MPLLVFEKTLDNLFSQSIRNYNLSQNIRDKLKFSCEIAHYRKSSISVFTSNNKIFILGGELSTR